MLNEFLSDIKNHYDTLVINIYSLEAGSDRYEYLSQRKRDFELRYKNELHLIKELEKI